MKGIGLILAAIGAFFVWIAGNNYAACQSVWMQLDGSNAQLCETARNDHFLGILLLIAGGFIVAVCMLMPSAGSRANRTKNQ